MDFFVDCEVCEKERHRESEQVVTRIRWDKRVAVVHSKRALTHSNSPSYSDLLPY